MKILNPGRVMLLNFFILISLLTITFQQGGEFAHSLIHSFSSNQMSDCERFTQIAKDKWATVSDLLRTLRGNKQMSDSLKKNLLKKIKSCFLVCFFIQFFMSDVSKSLRGNEGLWENRSGRSPKMSEWVNCSFFWANRSFAYFWAKNERLDRKTNEKKNSTIRLMK